MASLLSSTKYLEENYQSFTTKNRIRENTSQNIEWGWYYSRSKSDTSQKKKIIDQYILWKFTWKDKIKILNLINSEINWASICFKDFFLSLNSEKKKSKSLLSFNISYTNAPKKLFLIFFYSALHPNIMFYFDHYLHKILIAK